MNLYLGYYLKDGAKRFSDLRRDNPTISHKMLTLELRKLEDVGVVKRTEYPGYPLRVEYRLTLAGQRLMPLIDALGDWWEAIDTEAGASEIVAATACSQSGATSG